MTSLRDSVLEGVDTLVGSIQMAFQSYGFLSANPESVIERDAGGSRFALLPDKSGEGWSAVEFPLPPDATFRQAASAVLSRTALWSTAQAPATVLALLTAHFASHPTTLRQDGPASTLLLEGLNTTIRVGTGGGHTLIAVRQRRPPESIRHVLKAKAATR